MPSPFRALSCTAILALAACASTAPPAGSPLPVEAQAPPPAATEAEAEGPPVAVEAEAPPAPQTAEAEKPPAPPPPRLPQVAKDAAGVVGAIVANILSFFSVVVNVR